MLKVIRRKSTADRTATYLRNRAGLEISEAWGRRDEELHANNHALYTMPQDSRLRGIGKSICMQVSNGSEM
jgi:hypothetical protein